MKQTLARAFLFVAVPLGDANLWQDISFSKIPKNVVTFQEQALTIKVNSSAGPLIHAFPSAVRIQTLKLELEISGDLKGEALPKIEEDSLLRLGIVVPGTRRLNFVEKMAAPAWVKKLFSLAPKDSGIEKIVFFNIGRNPSAIGQTRVHPKSELMEERVVWLRTPTQLSLKLEHVLNPPLSAAALWISADGDDSKSSFEIKIKKLEYE